MAKHPSAMQAALEVLANARQVAVLSGAGISKESGIPTFRDAQTGLWANCNPEDLASRQGFMANPRMVWEWYDFRRNTVWKSQPNPGHFALVELEKHLSGKTPPTRFTLITQNVDNLHQQAGSSDVLELHGSIFRYKCLEANHPIPGDYIIDCGTEHLPPRCPQCQSHARPDVVWFGEMLPEETLNRAFEAAETADCILVVGTSGVVHPAASLPMVGKRSGAVVIEINPEQTALTPHTVDHFLQGPSGQVLPQLVTGLLERLQ